MYAYALCTDAVTDRCTTRTRAYADADADADADAKINAGAMPAHVRMCASAHVRLQITHTDASDTQASAPTQRRMPKQSHHELTAQVCAQAQQQAGAQVRTDTSGGPRSV
jgi:hypothetical protein